VMVLVATFVWGASSLLFSTGPPARAQEGRVQMEAVTLTSTEQAEIHAGEVILREVTSPGLKGRTYEAVGILAGTLEEALAIVTDYRRHAEFMPRVERTVVTDESETVSLIEEYLKLPLGVHKRYRLRYTLRRGAEGFRVDWVKVPWPEVPLSQSVVDTSGYWQITRFGEGRLLAVYHVYTDPGRVPLGMKGLALSLSKHEIPKIIERVRQRLLSRSGTRDRAGEGGLGET
jgi:hypothetical protein